MTKAQLAKEWEQLMGEKPPSTWRKSDLEWRLERVKVAAETAAIIRGH